MKIIFDELLSSSCGSSHSWLKENRSRGLRWILKTMIEPDDRKLPFVHHLRHCNTKCPPDVTVPLQRLIEFGHPQLQPLLELIYDGRLMTFIGPGYGFSDAAWPAVLAWLDENDVEDDFE